MFLKVIVLSSVLASASAFCANSCSGHGTCGQNDICECYDLWTAPDCSQRQCSFGLSWVTSSAEELKEASTPSWPEGFHSYTECSSKGVCDTTTGQCRCFNGYGGKGCRRSSCPNSCSGHGVCGLDSDVKNAGYGRNKKLFAQKQYWNGGKSQQCICDAGFSGYDCSVRICPQGDDPESTCSEDIPFNDIQLVSVKRDPVSANMKNVEQFFTLTFTDMFNSQYTTKPLSFYDDAATVQQALRSLPNYVIPDVEVFKIFPKETASASKAAKCSSWYYDNFMEVTCKTDTDCQWSKLSNVGGQAFCDQDIWTCVETDATTVAGNKCEYKGKSLGDDCLTEADGIYKNSKGKQFWGRRLTAYDRGASQGVWQVDSNQKFFVPCKTLSDCTRVAPWTKIRAGDCISSGGQKMCTARKLSDTSDASVVNTVCDEASFFIKFSSSGNQGKQNTLSCTAGKDSHTNSAGSSPRYESSGISSCSVLHVGVPEWRESTRAPGVKTDQSLRLTVKSGAAPAFESSGHTKQQINSQIQYQNYFLRIDEDEQKSKDDLARDFVTRNTGNGEQLYTSDEINNSIGSDYDEIVPCSNQGKCNYDTGKCTCEDGFTGEACERQINYV